MRDLFAVFEGPEAREQGSCLKAVMTLANHPRLARAWLDYNVFFNTSLSLPRLLCELVILRVAWRLGSEYEWTQHIVFGESLGLTWTQIEGVKQGPGAPAWNELERLSLQLVDELLADGQVEDVVWDRLATLLGTEQLLELLFLIGTYEMLARILNALRVQPEALSASERRRLIRSPSQAYGRVGREDA